MTAAGGEGVAFFYDHAPCGHLVTTPNGEITSVNATFCRLTGYSPSDLVGARTFASVLTVGGRIYHETHYAPTLHMQGHAREMAFDVVCATGDRLPMLINAVLDRDVSGAPLAIRIAAFEATERRSYELELLGEKRRAEESEARARVLAHTLQRTLMPHAPPSVPGLELAVRYRPAGDGGQIGGDFYDVFQIGVDDWMIVLGDVEGKGVEAAVVTSLARHSIRAAAVEHERPSEVLQVLNSVLRLDETSRYCTATVLRCRREHDRWSVSCASGGHPLPLLCVRGESPREMCRPGSLVGVFDDVAYSDATVIIGGDDTVVVYTDGVSEARQGRDVFGEERLHAIAADTVQVSVDDAAEAILREAVDFQGGVTRDDIAIVVFRSAPIAPAGHD